MYIYANEIAQHDNIVSLSNYRDIYHIGFIGTSLSQLYQKSTKKSAHVMYKKTLFVHKRKKHNNKNQFG